MPQHPNFIEYVDDAGGFLHHFFTTPQLSALGSGRTAGERRDALP